MTDAEAAELARSCLLAVLNNDLEAVAFTETLRRGLQKWLDKPDVIFYPDEVQWQSLKLIEKRRFPDLDAFLFRVDVKDGVREVLVGINEANLVSQFAFVGTPHDMRPRKWERLFMGVLGLNNAWFNVASFSTSYNLDGLVPFETSAGSGGNRNDRDRIVFHVKVAPASWEALSSQEQERILDGLEHIALGDYWLHSKQWGTKQTVRVTIVESRDTHVRGTFVSHCYAGDPPAELVLAERFVNIPSLDG